MNPGHNRVYFNTSRILSLSELSVTNLSVTAVNIREQAIGGVPYLLFDTETELNADDIVRLSRLSFTYAIYNLRDGALVPLEKNNSYYFNDDISTILKYTGKTNELFTRLMLNIAVTHSAFKFNDNLNVLDPLCGKGTTLFESLLLGYNACGIETDDKPANEAFVFLKKYLENARYKHESHTEKTGGVSEDGKKFSAARYRVTLARSKDDKREGRALNWEIITGDTRYGNTYYKKNSFHVIVGDLPYGVQHGSKAKQDKPGQFTRNALTLVEEALPVWLKLLKPGGVIVLAWNLFLIPRAELVRLFESRGLSIPEGIDGFKHRVDQAIERDIIVGRV
jgi:SAM-dependent methyltransferase